MCGVTSSSVVRGPIVSASRTRTQPDGVFHVVERTFEPGSYDPRGRVVDPEGPEPEVARLAVEQGAEHAGRVEAGEAQPVDRPVGRDQGAGVAVGQERVVGDGRERGRRRGALGHRVVHDAIHGLCQPPCSAVSRSASAGPQDPGAYAWTGGGASSNGCMTRQVSSTPSCRVNRVLSPRRAACRSTSYGVAPSPPCVGELHVQVDPPDRRDVAASCVQDHPDPGRRVQLDDDLVRLRSAVPSPRSPTAVDA